MTSTQNNQYFKFSSYSDDDDSTEGYERSNQVADTESGSGSRAASRSSGACVHCKSLKVRCEFTPGEKVCQRCQAGGHDCTPRNRKKRKPAPTHEDLQEKSHRQDRQIESLLLKFDQLRTEKKIREWMARSGNDSSPSEVADSSRYSTHPKREYADGSVELAVSSYFPNGRAPGRHLHPYSPPDIVKFCALYPDEILELFSIFFARVNPYFSILDPHLHKPEKLIWTCPFLFTCICAIASRYYTKRPNLYHLAMEFVRDAAGKALVDGSKSVDVCQAYLLMAVYPVPKKKWSEDRSWLLMGVAIRMALELGLDQPSSSSFDERENLNRARTWLNCFCVDGSHATQFGKLPMLRLDDYMARNCHAWYQSSSMNLPFDIHLCAYVEIIALMAEFRTAAGGYDLPRKVRKEEYNACPIAIEYDKKLVDLMSVWIKLYADDPNTKAKAICEYRGNTTQMITEYLRLVILSWGFQHGVKEGISRDCYVVRESLAAARNTIEIMTRRLYCIGDYLRYAMDANFLYVSFAAAFLINYLRPKFIVLLGAKQVKDIVALVRELIGVLDANAVDGRHAPALYSRFLSSLLARHNIAEAFEAEPPNSTSEVFVPQYSAERQQTPPNLYSWPDTSYIQQDHPSDVSRESGMIYQLSGEADMDFSMQHFMHTLSAQDAFPGANYESAPGPTDPMAFGEWESYHQMPMQDRSWPALYSEQYVDVWGVAMR